MILKFDQFLNESLSLSASPDIIEYKGKTLLSIDNEACSFVWSSSQHKIYIGDGKSHSSLFNVAPNETYPGRIWKESKIIIFWVYPSAELFLEMCNSFEKDHNIKILDNGWKIVVLKMGDDIKRKSEGEPEYSGINWRECDSDGNLKYDTSIIPVEEYVGSEDIPDEVYQQHLLSPLHKKGNVITRFPGYKHKSLPYQLPGEIEAKARARMYQESNQLNEGNITDVVFHRTSIESLYRILQSGKILLSTSMGGSADLYSKHPYFLSLSRTKNPKLGYSKNSVVSIEFDGRELKTKYKGKSIDYWASLHRKPSPKERADSDEFEDRLFSNSPYLENLEKYIKHIDIVLLIKSIATFRDYVDRTLLKIKEVDSPLVNKIRIYKDQDDFLKNKNSISIKDFRTDIEPKEDEWHTSREVFDYDILKKIITVLLVGNPQIEDNEYVEDFIRKYFNKFIKLGVEKLKNVTDPEIKSIRYDIQRKVEGGWLATDWDFINGLQSRIHNITKSSSKSEINYKILKILSDELLKYKVNTIVDLIKAKEGNKVNKKIDYSEFYTFVYKRDDNEYILLSNNRENILWWHKLRKYDIDRIFDTLPRGQNSITTKYVINYMFNNYSEELAKRYINSIMDDKDYILVDTRNKMVYPEIFEKGYEEYSNDRGKSLSWSGGYGFIDRDKWYEFIKENSPHFEKFKSKIQKIRDDEDVRVRYIYGVTEKMVGRKKADEFFDDNDLTISREREYMINIGKPVLVPDPNLFIKTNY